MSPKQLVAPMMSSENFPHARARMHHSYGCYSLGYGDGSYGCYSSLAYGTYDKNEEIDMHRGLALVPPRARCQLLTYPSVPVPQRRREGELAHGRVGMSDEGGVRQPPALVARHRQAHHLLRRQAPVRRRPEAARARASARGDWTPRGLYLCADHHPRAARRDRLFAVLRPQTPRVLLAVQRRALGVRRHGLLGLAR